MGNGPHPPGDPQADLAAADADNVIGQIPLRSAKPIDPPIKPTPTIATFPSRFIIASRPVKAERLL